MAEREPIAVAILLGSLEFGGAERHVTHLLEGLDKRRFRPLLYLTRRRGPFLPMVEALGIPVRETGVRSVFTAAGARGILRLSRELRRERVRLVHSYLYGANLIGLSLAALDPTLVHLIALRRQLLPHGYVFRPLFRWAEGPRTRFVSVSHGADSVLGAWGIQPRNRYRVPNGVVLPPPTGIGQRSETRAELGVPVAAPLVTMVANFHPIKGHRSLIRAFALLLGEMRLPPVAGERTPRLCLVGDGRLTEECRALAASLGLGDIVLFPGRRGDIDRILGASDVFVLNSRSEGMSNALLEAIASGLPCVATEVGGNPEVVVHGENGYLVPPEQPAPLARALLHLLTDPGLRAGMGRASRERARLEFSIEEMVRRTEAIYEEVLASGFACLGTRTVE